MASGLLGAVTLAPASSTQTVYTVPGGITHAVVHITLNGPDAGAVNQLNTNAYVAVNGNSVLQPSGVLGTNNLGNAVSMMLSPGNVVTVNKPAGSGMATCTVSGYEVV
jgi:hypothetical protein